MSVFGINFGIMIFFHNYESQNANCSLVFLQGPQGVPGQQGNPGKDVSIWCLINPLYL